MNSKAFAIPILTISDGLIYSSQNRDSKCLRIYLFSFFNNPRAPSSQSQKQGFNTAYLNVLIVTL